MNVLQEGGILDMTSLQDRRQYPKYSCPKCGGKAEGQILHFASLQYRGKAERQYITHGCLLYRGKVLVTLLEMTALPYQGKAIGQPPEHGCPTIWRKGSIGGQHPKMAALEYRCS